MKFILYAIYLMLLADTLTLDWLRLATELTALVCAAYGLFISKRENQ